MDRSLEEAKLIEFCEDLELGAAVNWQDLPASLHLVWTPEATLFGPGEGEQKEGRAVLTVSGGQVVCRFEHFEIGAVQLGKICKLFLKAYMRHLEDFYICNTGRE